MAITALREVSLGCTSIEDVSPGLAAVTGHPGFEIQEQPRPPISARFRSFAVGDRSIAVMDSIGEGTAITRYLSRFGPGTFSMTFEVEDVERECERLKAGDARLVLDEPMQLDGRTGSEVFESIRINFVSPAGPMHGLVVELQELRGGRPAPLEETPSGPDVPTAINELHCAVRDVEAAASDLARLFGFEVGPEIVQPEPPEQVRYRNLYLGERPVLALIGPSGPDSSVRRFLDRRGPGIFAISLRVEDGAAYQRRVETAGVRFLFPEPKRVEGGRIGPLTPAAILVRWVTPKPEVCRTLFEVQQFEGRV